MEAIKAVLLCLPFFSMVNARFELCNFNQPYGTERCHGGTYCPNGMRLVGSTNLHCNTPGYICCRNNNVYPPPPLYTTYSPPQGECGIVSPTARIGLGRDALKCSAPWQVSLRRRIRSNEPLSMANSAHMCGGTLISRNWILTTPFCGLFVGAQIPSENPRDNILIVLGEFNHLAQDRRTDGSAQEQTFTMDSWVLHPNFPKANNFPDLLNTYQQDGERGYQANAFMLIRLARPAVYNECVRPACLPSASDLNCGGSQCKMTGWGYNQNDQLRELLQEADMSLYPQAACSAIEFYRAGMTNLPQRTACIRNKQGSFPCVGDQGGPVTCRSNNRWFLRGLLLAKLECNAKAPLPVADVAQAVDWIRSTANI